ncbi:MAG TPA: energy transducer TonB [Opitutaceae bacterium]|nr:energy transducer TonB [Opitutaceae bacterium]
MITKIALLPRLFPGLFHLPPSATSAAGYRMPRERFLVYGISVSALLHAAVLCEFGPPATGGDLRVVVAPRPIPPELFTPLALEEAVPVKAEVEAKKDAATAEASDSGEPRATLTEMFRDPGAHAITVNLGRIAPPVMPDSTRTSWDVPRTPPRPSSRVVRGDTWNADDLDKKPVITSRAAPRYPYEMKRGGLSGTVLLRFIVDTHGNVDDVEVVSSTDPEFSRSAVEAMLRWKFRPGMKNNRRVNTRMEMPMSFALDKGV